MQTYMYFYFMGLWLSARSTHAACEQAEKWINKVERKINKIRCRKHSLPIAFLSCVCRGTKLAARLSTLVTSVSSTGRSNREDQVQGHAERRWRMCTFLTIFLGFYLLHYLVCYKNQEKQSFTKYASHPTLRNSSERSDRNASPGCYCGQSTLLVIPSQLCHIES